MKTTRSLPHSLRISLLASAIGLGLCTAGAAAACESVRLTTPALLKAQPAATAQTYSHGKKGEIFQVVMDGGRSHVWNGWWLLRRSDGRRFWVHHDAFSCNQAWQAGWESPDGKAFSQNFLQGCHDHAAGHAPAATIEQACNCLLDQFRSRYSVSQLAAMQAADPKQLAQIMRDVASACAPQS